MEKNNDKVVKKVSCEIVESSFLSKDNNDEIKYYLLRLPIADGIVKGFSFKSLGITSLERQLLLDELKVVSK